jgi:uncharacterized protein YhfF
LRDRIVDAVLRGEKTATSSLLAEWEADRETLPAVGDRLRVIDSEERAVAVIELVSVDVIRLGDADASLAGDEGEGFESVAEWREEHERFWSEQVLPELPDPTALTDETRIVVERFRLAEPAQ